jgi:hypothetical protein
MFGAPGYLVLSSDTTDYLPYRGLERQIESGSLTLTGEKKALADISASKRARKAVEQFQVEQDAVDAERTRAEELRKELVSKLSTVSRCRPNLVCRMTPSRKRYLIGTRQSKLN